MNDSDVMSPGMARTFIEPSVVVSVVPVVVMVDRISCRVCSRADGWMSVIAIRVQPALAKAMAVAAPIPGFVSLLQ